MRIHLYEFQSSKRKLKCLCGWEKTLKMVDASSSYKIFEEHCAQQAPIR